MLIELGNHACALPSLDDQPKVTHIHIPEADDQGLGGYSHKPGTLSVSEFRAHRQEANDYRGGITSLPDHEALLAIAAAWPTQGRERPAWVSVTPHPDLTPDGHPGDLEAFLRDFYEIPDSAAKPPEDEFQARYWTPLGAPGQGFPQGPPLLEALFTNSGRVISNINDGGGKVGLSGTGTAATATTLTTGTAMTLNEWAGYRVYVMQTATGPLVWGNVLSNTTAGVLTVDQWYNAATPGGAAATTPSAGWYYMLADGGAVSAWFVALTTTNITPAAADTALSGEYGTASGGFLRKIAPYTQTSGVATRSFTLVPVYTGNGSDTYPSTFFAIGVGVSMVRPFPTGTMKFETSLNASATVNATGDQVTVTETVTGS